MPITWPILGLAVQKNYISLYNSANRDSGETPFTCAYAGKLGRAKVSTKGVVTFNDLDDRDLGALGGMITAIATGLASGHLVPS